MVGKDFTEKWARAYMKKLLPQLDYWKRYDGKTCLGNQLKSELGVECYYGIIADMDFIMVSTYGADGSNPELVVCKKR